MQRMPKLTSVIQRDTVLRLVKPPPKLSWHESAILWASAEQEGTCAAQFNDLTACLGEMWVMHISLEYKFCSQDKLVDWWIALTNPLPIKEKRTVKPENLVKSTFSGVVHHCSDHRDSTASYKSLPASHYLPRDLAGLLSVYYSNGSANIRNLLNLH